MKALLTVDFSFYVQFFLLWSFHIWYKVMGNTFHIFLPLFLFHWFGQVVTKFKFTSQTVKHMSLSFTCRHYVTQLKELVNLASCSLIFKLRLLSQKFCMLAWPQNLWFGYTNGKKVWVPSLSPNFHKFSGVSYSHANSVAVHSNYFCYLRNSSTQKYCSLVIV